MRAAVSVDQALQAAGGLEAWRRASSWQATLSTGGLAFRTRGQSDVREVRTTVATSGQRVTLDPFPQSGLRTAWETGRVTVAGSNGDPVEQRHVTHWGRSWDALDMAAFVGMALWTYASLPFVLANEDIIVEPMNGRRLRVHFPDDIHTH